MKNVLLFGVVWVMMVLPVSAELGDEYRDWAEGPEGFLLTEVERSAWSSIADDQAAEDFIELFWAKRDPDLSTRMNEFRVQFDSRVEAADAEFAEEESRGAMTDRGRTLILLGVPKEHARAEIGEYLARLYRTGQPPRPSSSDNDAHIQMQGVSFNLNKGRADLWGYGQEQLPAGIEWPTKSDLISFAFFDHEGEGLFRTQRGIRKSADAAAVLNEAPAALVVNPDLLTVPVFGLIPGVPSATSGELEWLEGPKLFEGAVAEFGPGAAGPGINVGWLSVRMPADAPPATALIGRLSQGGEIVGSFRMAASGQAGPLGVLYEAAIPVPAGLSVLDLALADSEGTLHVERFDLSFVAEDRAFFTPVYAGASVGQQPDAAAGEPFIFGGYHLATRPDGRYLKGENLALFCLLVVPETEQAVRTGTVRMRWYVDGKATPNQPAQPAQFSPAGSSTWLWGTQLPLEGLSIDHRYELKVTIKDTDSGASSTTRLPVVFVTD